VVTKVPAFPPAPYSSSSSPVPVPPAPVPAPPVTADLPAVFAEPSPLREPPAPDPSPDAITVLVVDDERSNVESIEKIFLREGMRVLSASDAKRALEMVRTHRVHVVLTDLMMPGTTGLELLRAIKQVAPDVEVVLMTAFGSVEAAVSAMRDGAYDFVEKPLKRISIVKSVRKAAERQKLVAENRSLKDEIKRLAHREIVGSSQALRRVIDVATQAAPSQATVLVLGESGTGKELLARYIHERSARARGPFVAVNCAAIPETILESELFGHEKGAFTGAIARKIGRLELAHEGTLFLDEVGELPIDLQPKLLRALQEREIERLGGIRPIAINVRLIAATNRDLAKMVAEKEFRSDLFYRLKVFPVFAPPLRDRVADIPILVRHFVSRHSRRMGKTIESIPPEAMDALVKWKWPGNIRELENFLERAVILSRGTVLHAPLAELEAMQEEEDDEAASTNPTLQAAERETILRALRDAKGMIGGPGGAAERLGLKRTTLNSKMKKLGIERGDYM
jgi:two-component system response regulator HydG